MLNKKINIHLYSIYIHGHVGEFRQARRVFSSYTDRKIQNDFSFQNFLQAIKGL